MNLNDVKLHTDELNCHLLDIFTDVIAVGATAARVMLQDFSDFQMWL